MLLSYLVFTMHMKLIVPFASLALYVSGQANVADGGGTGLWIFANISYAGMRAQDSASWGWRIIAFIFGFPGTLISLIVITQGSQRAYGIDLPKRKTK